METRCQYEINEFMVTEARSYDQSFCRYVCNVDVTVSEAGGAPACVADHGGAEIKALLKLLWTVWSSRVDYI